MAIVKTYVPVDFINGKLPLGDVDVATSSRVEVSNGYDWSIFSGYNYRYSGDFLVSGTTTRFEAGFGSTLAMEAFGFTGDAPTVGSFVLDGDLNGLMAYVLAFDDEIYASGHDDILAGFAGGDFFDPAGGNDIVYGGSGVDAVFLKGLPSDYEIIQLGANVWQTRDRFLGDGNEGTDTLYDVELLEFSLGQQVYLRDLVNPVVWFQQGGNVSLVAATYQFFTDRIPTADGFGYLISSTANPNDLNDLYYANFNVENRYINFASNLGTAGEGATFFDRAYGSLNFTDAVKTAYLEVMGKELMGAALDFFLNAQGFYQAVAAERVVRPGVDLSDATKIVAIGSILNEAVKLGQGPYADAVEVLVADVAPDGVSYKLGGDLFAVA